MMRKQYTCSIKLLHDQHTASWTVRAVKLMRSPSERSLWNWRLFSLTHQEYSGVVRIYISGHAVTTTKFLASWYLPRLNTWSTSYRYILTPLAWSHAPYVTGIFLLRPMRSGIHARVTSYGNYDEILGFLFHETTCLFADGEIPTIEPLYKSHLLCCFLVLVMILYMRGMFIQHIATSIGT